LVVHHQNIQSQLFQMTLATLITALGIRYGEDRAPSLLRITQTNIWGNTTVPHPAGMELPLLMSQIGVVPRFRVIVALITPFVPLLNNRFLAPCPSWVSVLLLALAANFAGALTRSPRPD